MTLHNFDYAHQDLLPSFHSPSSLSEWYDFASAQAMQPDPAALRHQMPRVSYKHLNDVAFPYMVLL